ncbi:MAG: hypothetical protein AAGI07_04740 [Bacteroidota bacterium]
MYMKTIKNLLIAILVAISFACSDDDILTEGEINAQKLNEITRGGSRNFDSFRIITGETSMIISNSSYSYSIEGSFLIIWTSSEKSYFNLANLIAIREFPQHNGIILSFEQ